MAWRRFFQRAQRDDLAAEIDHYVAAETDDNIARGMSADAARTAAMRKFGNRAAVREVVYGMNTINWADVLTQDLKYGLRQLRLRPGFALAAILSLALGIGANTAIFTLVDQLLLRLLPVEDISHFATATPCSRASADSGSNRRTCSTTTGRRRSR